MARHLGLGAYRVAATLLLADGRRVTAGTLAAFALPWGGSPGSVQHWIATLRTSGCQIVTSPRRGYRLLEIPPDDLLETVLTLVDQLRAEYPEQAWSCLGRAIGSRAA